jgi:hypothetical protein
VTLSVLDARDLRLTISSAGAPQADATRFCTRLEQMMQMGGSGSLQKRLSLSRQPLANTEESQRRPPSGQPMSGFLSAAFDDEDESTAAMATFTEGPLGDGSLLADWDDATEFDHFAAPDFAASNEQRAEESGARELPTSSIPIGRGQRQQTTLPRAPLGYGAASTPPSEASSLGRSDRTTRREGAKNTQASSRPARAHVQRASAFSPSVAEDESTSLASAVDSLENEGLSRQTLAEVQEELEANETRGPASEPTTLTGIPVGARCEGGGVVGAVI